MLKILVCSVLRDAFGDNKEAVRYFNTAKFLGKEIGKTAKYSLNPAHTDPTPRNYQRQPSLQEETQRV